MEAANNLCTLNHRGGRYTNYFWCKNLYSIIFLATMVYIGTSNIGRFTPRKLDGDNGYLKASRISIQMWTPLFEVLYELKTKTSDKQIQSANSNVNIYST